MSKKLTILFAAIDGIGHFNACIGIAEPLRDRGHKIVFATPDDFKNKLTPHGFIEEWLNIEDLKEDEITNLEKTSKLIAEMSPAFLLTPEQQISTMLKSLYEESTRRAKEQDPRLREIVEKVKPDVIIADFVLHQPGIMDAGIPWILSMSVSPSIISCKNTPPAFSGYPIDEKDKSIWDSYNDEYKRALGPLFEDIKKWVAESGGPEMKYYPTLFLKYSPYANIYQYPEELDYTQYRPNPPNFHRFDTFTRSRKESFKIPEKLNNKSGKLIYFSIGTIGCSELVLMRRLISILAKSPNRFIVSKGPFSDQIELPENMWGAPSVPQLSILPLVDLVISHGGNNTVLESFYFGKPLIILPLFADQPDNAQRVSETGHGLRFHAYHCAEAELLEGIEKLLTDDKLTEKMDKIGLRIRSANNQSRVADLIEKVAENGKI